MRIEFTFLFFCLDLVFVMSCAGTIRSQTFNLVEVVESVKERMYSIEKEIGDLGDHEWAGTYVRRFSVDSFITLRLAPNSGAAFQFQENSGVVSQGFAKLAVKDSGLTLTWEQATVPLESLSTELIVVQFRSNVFLVPPREVHGFCLERHSDNMPRSYFSSKRRLAIRETSDIALPEEYRKFEDLPATVARVIQADEAQLFRSGEAVWGVQLVTINVGSRDSVLLGARFIAKGNPSRSIVVTKVMEDKSIAKFEGNVLSKKGFQQIALSEELRSGMHVMDIGLFENGKSPSAGQRDAVNVPSKIIGGRLFPMQ